MSSTFIPGRTPVNARSCWGLRLTSVWRSASERSGLATMAWKSGCSPTPTPAQAARPSTSRQSSAAFEIRFSFLIESTQSFPSILGADEPVIRLDLELHRRDEVLMQASPHRMLRLAHGNRGQRCDARGDLEHTGDHAPRLAKPVHDAPGERLLRRKRRGRKDQLLGASFPDDTG